VAVRKGKFKNSENLSVIIPIQYARELLSRVPDLNASCTFIASVPPQPTPAPYPSSGEITLDGIKLGHLTQDLKVACGQKHRTIGFLINWDRSSRNLPAVVTTCDVSGDMSPGNAYYIADVWGLQNATGQVFVTNCFLINQNSIPH
jgi:hypothetical protein